MRNVLILVDDYTSAAAAARHIAAKIAPGQVDRALLLHVHAPIRSYAAQFFGAEALRSMREADGARLAGDARASLEGAGVKVEVRTEQGEIAPVTVEVARERAVDTIVMANPGGWFFRQLMFRLLVWQVVRRAEVPVLVVGAGGDARVADRARHHWRPAYHH